MRSLIGWRRQRRNGRNDQKLVVAKIPQISRVQILSPGRRIGTSQQSEYTFSDDALLEDGFDKKTSKQTTRMSDRQESLEMSDMDEVYEEVDEKDEEEDGDEVEDDDDADEEEDM